MAVNCFSLHKSSINPCISIRVKASRAPSGSSNNSSSGSWISALASATLCFCPPDNTAGQTLERSANPTCSNILGIYLFL